MKNRILKHFVWWIPAVSGLIACQTQDSLSPSGLEGQIGGRILVEGDTPAGGARVDVFRCGDTTMFPVARAFSGTDGVYQVDGLKGGCYSVLMDDGAGNVAFSTSLRLDHEAPKVSLDGKLRPWGYVAGKISVQPWDSPRIARVVGEGFGVSANVDDSGKFRLRVPSGSVRLAIFAPYHQYVAASLAVDAVSGEDIELGTVALNYVGVPEVEGVRVSWDSLAGVATIRWNPTHRKPSQGYRIKRRAQAGGGYFGEQYFPTDFVSLGSTVDTTFRDTLYRPGYIRLDSVAVEYAVEFIDDGSAPYRAAWTWVPLRVGSPWVIPAKAVRYDTLAHLPPGCFELDTLGGGLVCLRDDSMAFWTSRDGLRWSAVSVPDGALGARAAFGAVAWDGLVWVLRALSDVDTQRIPLRPGTYRWSDEEDAWTTLGRLAPLHRGVVVEAWSLDGVLERRDTLLARLDNVAHFRLAVHDGQLLLSEDTEIDRYGANWSDALVSTSIRRLPSRSSIWSDATPGPYPSEGRGDSLMRFSREKVSSFWSSVEWNGLIVERVNYGGSLITRSTRGDQIPWLLADSLSVGQLKYRGNGEQAPSVLTMGGCLIIPRKPHGSSTGGALTYPVSRICPDSTP